MNDLWTFAFVIFPLSITAFGMAVAFLYGRGQEKSDRDFRPGE